jgi:hypothetical protein
MELTSTQSVYTNSNYDNVLNCRGVGPHGRGRKRRLSSPSPEDEYLLRKAYMLDSSRQRTSEPHSNKRAVLRVILERHPDWSRQTVWKLARKLGIASRKPVRPWSKTEVDTLMAAAGNDSLASIAQALKRSPISVKLKLKRLVGRGCSSVTEGYTKRWVAKALHIGFYRVNDLIEQGLLELKNSAVLRFSLQEFINQHAPRLGIEISAEARALLHSKRPSIAQMRINRAFRVKIVQVRRWVNMNLLQPVDAHITMASFEAYCRQHAGKLHQELMDRDERDWFATELDVPIREAKEISTSHPTLKHLLTVRQCPGCRTRCRGNGFFMHVRRCPRLSALRQNQSGALSARAAA